MRSHFLSWKRMLAILAGTGVVLWTAVLFLQYGFDHWRWSPPIVAMISLTVSNLALVAFAISQVRERRRKKRQHA